MVVQAPVTSHSKLHLDVKACHGYRRISQPPVYAQKNVRILLRLREKSRRLLQDAVAEYRPVPSVVDLVAARRAELGWESDNVTDLQSRRRTGAGRPAVAPLSHPALSPAKADELAVRAPSASI